MFVYLDTSMIAQCNGNIPNIVKRCKYIDSLSQFFETIGGEHHHNKAMDYHPYIINLRPSKKRGMSVANGVFGQHKI
jgi:hypothetical protein